MRIKLISGGLAIAFMSLGCSSSASLSDKSDPSIRAVNCQLIYDWIDYRQAPENENFWYTQVNTYDFYALIEERLFSRIKDGDSSYDTILEVRTMEYDSNLYNAPPIGTPITQSTYNQYRKSISATEDSFMPEEDKWEIINALSSSCDRFTAEEFANEFAPVLLMD